ncbi:hypothetical protein OS493_009336 [Desmophyllum pertusum]|uniref:Platelet-derived growth factor (PDGF) family profile domain-containing protein n=1 Tax=Desmophyllum pertusum TaxID=174260 RepID=A0A9X0CTV6_9CNID|nr:hypothetical protein OS493_009336 [Desmophyllum pertusum]
MLGLIVPAIALVTTFSCLEYWKNESWIQLYFSGTHAFNISLDKETETKNMQESFALLILLPLLGNSVRINNEFCSPRPSLVPIDNPNYKYFPYFVKLHRCGGSCDTIQPSVQSCIPLQYEEVPVTVKVVGTLETKIIKEKNHTRCGCECVISQDNCNLEFEDWRPDLCQCQCKYGDTPPKPCEQGLDWSKNHCRCMCNKTPELCGPNKV